MTTSETEISSFTKSMPFELRTFNVALSLLQAKLLKSTPELRLGATPRAGAVCRIVSALSGHSTRITSAPNIERMRVVCGPARTQVKSTTLTPESAPSFRTRPSSTTILRPYTVFW